MADCLRILGEDLDSLSYRIRSFPAIGFLIVKGFLGFVRCSQLKILSISIKTFEISCKRLLFSCIMGHSGKRSCIWLLFSTSVATSSMSIMDAGIHMKLNQR